MFKFLKVFFFGVSQRCLEFFKYDLGLLSLSLSILFYSLALTFFKLNRYSLFIKFASKLHGSTWYASEKLSIKLIQKLATKLGQHDLELFFSQEINSYQIVESRTKFLKDPAKLFKNTIIVLRAHTNEQKGLIIIKYSYYFLMFLKLFDADKVFKHYHLVLEPSWAGYFSSEILAFTNYKHKVFVMCYENKDKRLLTELNANLIPVSVGPNWWVPPVDFDVGQTSRQIDLVIVASWSKFKRHFFIFKALAKIKVNRPDLKVVLIGYAGDLNKSFILDMAEYFNIKENIVVVENIKFNEVFDYVGRAKASILWSRFEGNNRSIIESMFCGTPVVFRQGHNFGDNYSYINPQTAEIANEATLPEVLTKMFDNYEDYSPSEYVNKHHNYKIATQHIEKTVSTEDKLYKPGDSVHKVNYLWGMGYLHKNDETHFQKDYEYLSTCILSSKSKGA